MMTFMPNLILGIVFFGLDNTKWGVINFVIAGVFLLWEIFSDR